MTSKPKAKNYFTPFILSSLIDMNNNYSRTPTPTFLQEEYYFNNNLNYIYSIYSIYIWFRESRQISEVGV